MRAVRRGTATRQPCSPSRRAGAPIAIPAAHFPATARKNSARHTCRERERHAGWMSLSFVPSESFRYADRAPARAGFHRLHRAGKLREQTLDVIHRAGEVHRPVSHGTRTKMHSIVWFAVLQQLDAVTTRRDHDSDRDLCTPLHARDTDCEVSCEVRLAGELDPRTPCQNSRDGANSEGHPAVLPGPARTTWDFFSVHCRQT